ncbi:MAG TPA: ABC transporter permease [Anaeromyxobacteraceae bacterium]|nr:ABC transporter permease [Anaeromyxobacteraceae bacterium]
MDTALETGMVVRRTRRLGRFVDAYGQELVVTAALLVLMAVAGTVNRRFLSETNLTSLFSGNAYVAVAAIGMSMVIISGNIDVSVGSLIGVLATISGTLAVKGYPIWFAWLFPVLVGVVVDAFIGVLVAYARIPAIVVTLGFLSILKGGLISATQGAWIANLPPGFFIAQFRVLGVPSPVYFAAVLTILAALWMRYSALGRAIYAVGGNGDAARAVGIRTKPMVVFIFALNGFFAGIAAILFGTQLQVIQSTVPPNLELNVITASVIGGVSILGGTGTVVGSSLAAVLFAAISSSLIFLNVSAYWLRAVLGLMILATVLADMARRRRIG